MAVDKKTLSFNEKLSAVQNSLVAPKGQYNNFGKYNYRSTEDILEAVKPLLKMYGLTVVISDKVALINDRYYIEATVTVSDGKDTVTNTSYAREPLNKKGMDESQITGATSSYARKYALNGMFLIDDNKDADSNEYHNQIENTPAEKPKKAPKKANNNADYLNPDEAEYRALRNEKMASIREFTGMDNNEIVKMLQERLQTDDLSKLDRQTMVRALLTLEAEAKLTAHNLNQQQPVQSDLF